MSDDAAEVPEEPVDPNTPGVIRPQPLPEKTEPAKPAEAAPAAVPVGEEPTKPAQDAKPAPAEEKNTQTAPAAAATNGQAK